MDEADKELRLVALRLELENYPGGSLDALIIPSEDAHQSEYVAECDLRRAYISGFDGSAGLALVTCSEALLWTDGRYYLQANKQLSSSWKLMRHMEDPVVEEWIPANLPRGSRVGVDPTCLSAQSSAKYEQSFEQADVELVLVEQNLVDKIWGSRPAPSKSPVRVHPLQFAGLSVPEKLSLVRRKMEEGGSTDLIVTALDEVAWLYNIRGSDVPYNPVVKGYAVVTLEEASLFLHAEKLTEEAEQHFRENCVQIRRYDDIFSAAEDLAMEASRKEPTVWMDPKTCNLAIFRKLTQSLPESLILQQPSPISLAKSVKHDTEVRGLREAHLRDGAAMASFLAWLDGQVKEQLGAGGYFSVEGSGEVHRDPSEEKLTEVSVATKLEGFRAAQKHFAGLSFPTISCVGPNSAVIHYRPEPWDCRGLSPGEMFLCDSGAQYLDGTTDVTRTVHFGAPSAHEKACFTKVLKGHISLGSAVFPAGTSGYVLDILARLPLWKSGLDYRHGTGHGVGAYLNVHEGPQLISFRPQAMEVPLEPNMTVTNEPGYYEEGGFGIRIENVMIVRKAETEFCFGGKDYLCFEPLTWVPIQAKLIEVALLSQEEKEWVDKYHRGCFERISPLLSSSDLEWLKLATLPMFS